MPLYVFTFLSSHHGGYMTAQYATGTLYTSVIWNPDMVVKVRPYIHTHARTYVHTNKKTNKQNNDTDIFPNTLRVHLFAIHSAYFNKEYQ